MLDNKFIRLYFLCIAILFMVGFDFKAFLYEKSATVPSSIDHEIGAILIDAELYNATNNAFSNLRVVDHEKQEVPYVVRKIRGNKTVSNTYTMDMPAVDFQENPDNSITVIYEKKTNDPVPDKLLIYTPIKNFEKNVSVYGSQDKNNWVKLTDNQPIFDYSKFIDVRNTDVKFLKKPYRYYKIMIDNITTMEKSSFSEVMTRYTKDELQEKYETFIQYQEPLRIDRVKFSGSMRKIVYGKNLTSNYPLTLIDTKTDEDLKATDFIFESMRHPLKEIIFVVSNKNFKRHINVAGTNDPEDKNAWQSITKGTISSIKAGRFSSSNLKITFSAPKRYKQYRVRVFNQDNPPIDITEASAIGHSHEILFFHNNKTNMTIKYGGEGIDVPKYDVASVLSDVPPVHGFRWTLSSQIVLKDAPKKPFLSGKTLLVIALVVMVGALGYILSVTAKKVDTNI